MTKNTGIPPADEFLLELQQTVKTLEQITPELTEAQTLLGRIVNSVRQDTGLGKGKRFLPALKQMCDRLDKAISLVEQE